jgi:hypothetical protein
LFVSWFMGFGIGLIFTFLFWHLQVSEIPLTNGYDPYNYWFRCNVSQPLLLRIMADLQRFSVWLQLSIIFLRYLRTSSVSNSFARWGTLKYEYFNILHWQSSYLFYYSISIYCV